MVRMLDRVLVLVAVAACSSKSSSPPPPAPAAIEAGVAATVDAGIRDAATPDAARVELTGVDAGTADAGVPSPSKPRHAAHQPCPACGIGCPHGVPSSAVDANGCTVCACEDTRPVAPR
jgi:hypothetical protein